MQGGMRRRSACLAVAWGLFASALLVVSPAGPVSEVRADNSDNHPFLCSSWVGQPGTVYSQPEHLEEPIETVPAPTNYNPGNKPVSGSWDIYSTPFECLSPPNLAGEPGGIYPAPGPPDCPSLTVRGRTFTYTSSSALTPVQWAEVYLWDARNPNDDNDFYPDHEGVVFLASGMTDADGRFEIGGLCNRDIDVYGNRVNDKLDLVIQIAARSTAAVVGRWYFTGLDIDGVTDFIYSGITGYHYDADSDGDGVFDVGNRVAPPSGGDLRWAFLAYSGMVGMWDALANRLLSPGYVPGMVHAHYLPPCHYEIIGFGCGPDGAGASGEPFPHYHVLGGDCGMPDRGGGGVFDPHPDDDDCPRIWRYLYNQIHIPSKVDVQSRHTLAHLYGHAIMSQVYSGYPGVGPLYGDCPIGETVPGCQAKDDSVATVGDYEDLVPARTCAEGSYLLKCQQRLAQDREVAVAWAEGWADYFATRMTSGESDPSYSISSPGQPTWTVNLETRDAAWTQQGQEGFVATVLNDLSDGAQDGTDSYSGTFQRVWNAFRFRSADSLLAFWQNWIDVSHASDHARVAGAVQAMRQNGLATAYAVVNHPSASDITSSSIRITWSNLGSNFNYAELHVSSSPGFYPTSSTRVGSWYSPNVPASFTVTGLTLCTRYYFEVLWWDTGGWPTHSNVESAQTSTGSGTASIGPIYVTGNGGPVSGASVSVRNCNGVQVYSGTTDTNGMVPGASGLPQGTYAVTATWTDWSECTGDPGQLKWIWVGQASLAIPPNQSPTIATAPDHSAPCPI